MKRFDDIIEYFTSEGKIGRNIYLVNDSSNVGSVYYKEGVDVPKNAEYFGKVVRVFQYAGFNFVFVRNKATKESKIIMEETVYHEYKEN